MTPNITFAKTPDKKSDSAVVFAYEGKKLSPSAKTLDDQTKGFIKNALATSENFTGKHGQMMALALPKGARFSRILLIGLGKAAELDALKTEEIGGKIFTGLLSIGAAQAALYADTEGVSKLKATELGAYIAAGLKLRSYNFDKYKSKSKDDKTKKLTKVEIITGAPDAVRKTYGPMGKTVEGVFTARDLVNEPPNELYPDSYAKFIQKELKSLGVEVTILDEKKMKQLGMGAILAVGKGSERPPRMVIMEWKGGQKSPKKTAAKSKSVPLALVGKGVTFDTGGISIKPAAGMDEMKMDMGGSAAVVGTMKAIALRKSKAHVVGIVGLAENMPSHNAYRPGDIIKSYAGKTIEVLNTDAEGRLVLVDCLTYVQKTYKPKAIIDLATLTGAMMVALGHEYCGTFVNDDKFWGKMEKASAETGEKLWRMPLDEVWKKQMESKVADLQNLGNIGRFAGACTAAGFLEHFIDKGVHWAHMDIAGTAWIKQDKPTVPKFGTGFGVRVLDRLISENYE